MHACICMELHYSKARPAGTGQNAKVVKIRPSLSYQRDCITANSQAMKKTEQLRMISQAWQFWLVFNLTGLFWQCYRSHETVSEKFGDWTKLLSIEILKEIFKPSNVEINLENGLIGGFVREANQKALKYKRNLKETLKMGGNWWIHERPWQKFFGGESNNLLCHFPTWARSSGGDSTCIFKNILEYFRIFDILII